MIETNDKVSKIVEIGTLGKKDRSQFYCLALNIYHEARGSTQDDQWAVGFVTRNRHYIKDQSICGVVWERNKVTVSPSSRKYVPQFSWTTASTKKLVPYEDDSWKRAQRIAYLILVDPELRDITGGATHFLMNHLVSKVPWTREGTGKRRYGEHTYMRLHKYVERYSANAVASLR